jgi:holo-[acyl-carrier protein] synthase
MEIIGYGIDVVDLQQFRLLLTEPSGDFQTRCFTAAEQQSASADSTVNREFHLAGRFAAKEAVAKALHCGFDGKISPLDIEIINSSAGVPDVILHGAAAALAKKLQISCWHVSISHAGPVSVAGAIAIKD